MFLAWGSSVCCAQLRRCQGTVLVAGCEALSWLTEDRDCCFWSKPLLACWYVSHSALWKWKHVIYQEPINFIWDPINLLKVGYLFSFKESALLVYPTIKLTASWNFDASLYLHVSSITLPRLCRESRNQKQMSQSRAPANESSCVYSRLHASHTANRSYNYCSWYQQIQRRAQDSQGCSIVLRCVSTSWVGELHRELNFRCTPSLCVGKTDKIPHYSVFISISSGIHFGIASGGLWKCLTVLLFFFFKSFFMMST